MKKLFYSSLRTGIFLFICFCSQKGNYLLAQPVIDFGTGLVAGNAAPFLTGSAEVTITGNDATVITNTTIAGGVYNFANFTIDSGVVLTVTGSAPLVIRVSGTAVINGVIAANGGDGVAGTNSGGPGGTGGGGGGVSGGAGGGFADDGTKGTSFGTSAGAGLGGDYSSSGCGGGGGGYSAIGSSGTQGSNGSGTVGAGGNAYGDNLLNTVMNSTVFLGGSGGGGGGGSSSNSGGGGGGGGAGAIQLSAVTLTFGNTGKITAIGGKGGNGDTGAASGPGGGGGGSGGTINLQHQSSNYVAGKNALVTGGMGGARGTGSSRDGGVGGNGSAGRILIQGPVLITNPSALDFGTVGAGSTSQPQFYILSGTSLTGYPGNILVTSPADFLISNNASGPWTSSLNVPFATDSLPGDTIWVRFAPLTTGAQSVQITHHGGGAVAVANVTGTTIPIPLFEQQFNSALASFSNDCVTSGIYASASPSPAQFTSICSGSSTRDVAVTGGALSLGTGLATTGSAFSRSADFSGSPNSLIFRWDFSYPQSGALSANSTLLTCYVGTGVTNDVTTVPTGINSQFNIKNNQASQTPWYAYDGVTKGTVYTSQQTITWVMNKSGSALVYKAPDGTYESIADTSWDLWVGTSRQFNDRPMSNTANDLRQFKFIWANHTNRGGSFDNMLIDPIPLPPVADSASSINPSDFMANWNRVTNSNNVQASGYLLDVSDDSTFATFLPGYNNLDVGDVTSYMVTVASSGSYYYRVRSYFKYTVNIADPYTSGHSNIIPVLILPTGILSLASNAAGMIITPNPAPGKFTISLNKSLTNASVRIFNTLGEEVYSSSVNSPRSVIDFSRHDKGIYFVQVKDESATFIQKVIIE